MKIGLIGLGRMGFSLGFNMRDHGHIVVAYNRSPEKMKKAEKGANSSI
ncbi:NAD(P)-binding domain-containing protein [Fonticella tunisiensis]|uniref:6-phosphogluconate dehydrogenase-like protein n=1 Tax=Fonticella tunisiensis TaxID=1096341 RepID=A0A4R7KPU3_9CLOT|nr:NAD(P)-binding domain-containing protein [Fonticella tunisiensis]TDT61159.1 6-phosphogluconate dehydrogenase-like protein [Fonticella tunisiensis]